jgi:hypothetical protein
MGLVFGPIFLYSDLFSFQMYSLSPGKMYSSTLYFNVEFFRFVVSVPVILFLNLNQIVLGADEALIRSNFADEISRQ